MNLQETIFKMRRHLRSLFSIVLFISLSVSSIANAVDQNYINQLVPRIGNLDREFIAENEYGYSLENVIQALRERDNEYTASHSRLLVRLRDEPTIEKYVSRFIESEATDGRAGGVLAGSYSPWVIPLIIDYLDAREIEYTQHPNPEVIGFWGFSGRTAIIIRGILRRSEEFPIETRAWAEELPNYGEGPLRELRDTLVVWWEENEAHFESENYHLVRPVSGDLEAEAGEDDPIRDDESEDNETPLRGIPESEETPGPDSETSHEGAEVRNPTTKQWVIGGIAVLTFLAFATFIVRSRRGSS
jgi:hypothetical protein